MVEMTGESRVDEQVVMVRFHTHEGGDSVQDLVGNLEPEAVCIEISDLLKVGSANDNVTKAAWGTRLQFGDCICAQTVSIDLPRTIEAAIG